jgi:hypothetical protein
MADEDDGATFHDLVVFKSNCLEKPQIKKEGIVRVLGK